MDAFHAMLRPGAGADPLVPSPANLQVSRLCALGGTTGVFASGSHLYFLQAVLPKSDGPDGPLAETDTGALFKLHNLSAAHATRLPAPADQQAELQSVHLLRAAQPPAQHDTHHLATVDASGRVAHHLLTVQTRTEGEGIGEQEAGPPALPHPFTGPPALLHPVTGPPAPPHPAKRRKLDQTHDSSGPPLTVTSRCSAWPGQATTHPGWHGCLLMPGPVEPDTIVSVGYWDRLVRLHTAHGQSWCGRTSLHPTALAWLQSNRAGATNSPLLAVAESAVVSIWDVRADHRACVRRLQQSTPGATIWALSTHADGLVAAGGNDKHVTVYDARKWAVCSKWSRPTKYEVTYLDFSQLSSSLMLVAGLDHELLCGTWRGQHKQLNARLLKRKSFRGDSRWLGIAQSSHEQQGDILGVTEQGTLYFLRAPHKLCHDTLLQTVFNQGS